MQVFKTTADLRDHLVAEKREGRSVAFVPTMGALHVGHQRCMETARPLADVLVVSIFVNPTQFAPGEDLDAYPRPLDTDLASCEAWGCDVVFTPAADAIYPKSDIKWVEPGALAEPMCGRNRPGHFRGVATVVARLFEIVEPDVAVFGQKDAQQALIIRDLTRRIDLPIRIVLAETVREDDGLATSSRNRYMNEAQRRRAAGIHHGLRVGLDAIANGTTNPQTVTSRAREFMVDSGILDVEYVELRDAETLADVDVARGHLILAAAVKVGSTRLIDNIVFRVQDDGAVDEIPLF